MILERMAKATLTPVELGHGDGLLFKLPGAGAGWEMTLISTAAEVVQRATPSYHDRGHHRGDIKVYAFTAVVRINGREHVLRREVGSQASFCEPAIIDGVSVWFDAAACAFIHPPATTGIIHEKDWEHRFICSPSRAARFALQVAEQPIAPEPVGEWFQGQPRVPDINNCYLGEDCWMGPYNGGAAHCGLDINMPKGTLLTAPIALDDQLIFNDARAGHACTRWRGSRRWADGSEWVIHTHHLEKLLVPERRPLNRGEVYAEAAGTGVGAREHSHFMFRVIEQGGDYYLDPWLLLRAVAR